MAIGSSTTLQGSGLAADLVRAFCLGVESSTGKVREMVSGVERAIALNNSMTRGSDADGDYLVSAGSTQYAQIADSFDPAGGEYTVVLVWKPSTLTPPDWVGAMVYGRAAGDWIWALGKYDGTADYYESRNTSSVLQHGGGLLGLAANTLQVMVVTWKKTIGSKIFVTGQPSPITSSGNTFDQSIVTADYLRIANSPNFDGSWLGKYYFFAYSDTAWSDVDAQAVADNLESKLFATGGGGAVFANTLSLLGVGKAA